MPNKTRHEGSTGNPGLFPIPKYACITLEEATIDQLQRHMSVGSLTAVQLLNCYLKRIYQVDEYINSVIELNPDALEIATALDAERGAGTVRGPLHGIPFVVKDNIATKDQMETTAGSWMLLGSVVPRDAHVVAKLRQAGALLMGKATLSEWADMRSPYNLTLSPGGGSSGGAAAVAADVAAFSLGTETNGSVINPAERNALVGIKPTVGLTSRAGVIPESIHRDSIGTFGRTLRDAAYAFDAIYGIDKRDNYTLAQDGKTPPGGYMQFLADKMILQDAKFGIPWNSFWVYADEEQQAVLLSLICLIESAGATIINNTELPNYQTIVSPDGWDWDFGTTRGYSNESEYTVNYANDGTEGGYRWPRGIPAFYSGQDGFLASLESKGVMDDTYFQALTFCQHSTFKGGIDAALANNGNPVDALLVPPDAGYPVITLPAGIHSETGMPFGLALMGTAWSEAGLLKWASAIEDLQLDSGTTYKRTLPNWYGYLERNVPIRNL
ncbi:glutamyl-tRNA amidotransferase subunit A [Lojkania enalia]|uniref:Glutamyl-tRNA amidotransferase subunit A n=1 Tax=Lojkania enalia TaxID=147567 RepID=A0A9P4K0Q2_9PLEO|nr:glutamyl-tRNA amidotransferase subunit A [Didymosphaeria enalia]